MKGGIKKVIVGLHMDNIYLILVPIPKLINMSRIPMLFIRAIIIVVFVTISLLYFLLSKGFILQ